MRWLAYTTTTTKPPSHSPLNSFSSSPWSMRTNLCSARRRPRLQMESGHTPWTFSGQANDAPKSGKQIKRAGTFLCSGFKAMPIARSLLTRPFTSKTPSTSFYTNASATHLSSTPLRSRGCRKASNRICFQRWSSTKTAGLTFWCTALAASGRSWTLI